MADGAVVVGTDKLGIALMPGAVFTTDAHYLDPGQLVRRSLPGDAGVVLGPPQNLGAAPDNLVAASAYRVLNAAGLRYGTGAPKSVERTVARLSGTRAVLNGSGVPSLPFNLLYDVRTGVRDDENTGTPWRYEQVDVFGNYLAYARSVGTTFQIRRRDLGTGADVLVATLPWVGSPLVAVNGNLVAWATGCPEDEHPCSQTVRYRVVGATGSLGAVKSFATRGTRSLDLSATHLALDTETSRREVRLVTLGSNQVRVVGTLPAEYLSGWITDGGVQHSAGIPVHFDLDNDRIAWLDAEQNALVAAVATPPIRARYLGNGVIPASFSGSFAASLPFSKTLTACSVTFRKGTTVVRTVPCTSRNGEVLIRWDGRDAAGVKVAKGKYQWTPTGRDGAGAALWYSGSTAPINATVEVR